MVLVCLLRLEPSAILCRMNSCSPQHRDVVVAADQLLLVDHSMLERRLLGRGSSVVARHCSLLVVRRIRLWLLIGGW